jgi:hypothetical protein
MQFINPTKDRPPRKTTSQFRGVNWHARKQLWRAAVSHHGTKIILGYFHSEVEAARAVNLAQLKYNGPQFAVLNVIE